MELLFFKKIDFTGLRNARIIVFNQQYYLLASNEFSNNNNKIKYCICLIKLDDELNVIKDTFNYINLNYINYFTDNNISTWLRDVYVENNYIYLLIEFKFNINSSFLTQTNLYKTNNFNTFIVVEEYNLKSQIISKKLNNNLFTSIMIPSNDNLEFIWGDYLFYFFINNEYIYPSFDCIDIKLGTGNLLHDISYCEKNNQYNLLLSVRYKIENYYMYKIYTSSSKDLVNYYNTKEIIFDKFIVNSDWLCYPSKFFYKNEEYVICNINDYGKKSKPVIFKTLF